MKTTIARIRIRLAGLTLCAMTAPWTAIHAEKSIHETQPADQDGSVEIVNLAGAVDLSGWDQPQIEVTGSTGDSVGRVDVTSKGGHATVRVVPQGGGDSWNVGGQAHLIIHLPMKSAISASLISADLKLKNLTGDMRLQTVSGNISGEASGDLRASTVSGTVHLKTATARTVEVKTVSGDILLSGGDGEADITTISGDAKVNFGTITRGRFKSVSGNMTAGFTLAADGQIQGESVSGNIALNFAAAPAAEFDVQSFSGTIHNCFGPKPVEAQYGPGSRLAFKNGAATGRVRVESKSGDIRLCTKDSSADKG